MDISGRLVIVVAQHASDEHAADTDGGLSRRDLATTDADDAAGVQRQWMPEYDPVPS